MALRNGRLSPLEQRQPPSQVRRSSPPWDTPLLRRRSWPRKWARRMFLSKIRKCLVPLEVRLRLAPGVRAISIPSFATLRLWLASNQTNLHFRPEHTLSHGKRRPSGSRVISRGSSISPTAPMPGLADRIIAILLLPVTTAVPVMRLLRLRALRHLPFSISARLRVAAQTDLVFHVALVTPRSIPRCRFGKSHDSKRNRAAHVGVQHAGRPRHSTSVCGVDEALKRMRATLGS